MSFSNKYKLTIVKHTMSNRDNLGNTEAAPEKSVAEPPESFSRPTRHAAQFGILRSVVLLSGTSLASRDARAHAASRRAPRLFSAWMSVAMDTRLFSTRAHDSAHNNSTEETRRGPTHRVNECPAMNFNASARDAESCGVRWDVAKVKC